MILLDTNVISAMRRPDRNTAVAAWAASIEDDGFFLSVISVMEIERGVARLRAKDSLQADMLQRWFTIVLNDYEERILPLSIPIARRWGQLSQQAGNSGADLAIAATALVHGLTIATRNISDFEGTGAATVNPFVE